MTRMMPSTFAGAAMLAVAASGVAMASTDASLMPASDPLRAANFGRITAAPGSASPDRSLRTAFTYIELLVVKSGGPSASKKKGLRANQQSGNQARRPARKSR